MVDIARAADRAPESADNVVPFPSASSPKIALADGAVAAKVGEAIELRDGEGHLLVRYEKGEATIFAARGDLKLSAPAGRVLIEGRDVAVQAARDLDLNAPRHVSVGTGASHLAFEGDKAKLQTTELGVNAKKGRVAVGEAEVLARQIVTSAERIATKVTRYELEAERLVEKAKDAFRDVTGLAQTRIGRAKTVVREVFSLRSKRSVLKSEQETKIDGSKVLLG